MKKLVAEFIGTLWLVLGGCGAAALAAGVPDVGIGFAGVALAFGLTVVTMAYAIGHISGCHLNPAVSIGLWAGGRFDKKDLIPYIIAQVLGGIAGAGILYLIVTGNGSEIGGFAANGYGEHSPGGYGLAANQIGINKNVCIVRVRDDSPDRILINPTITKSSDDRVLYFVVLLLRVDIC